MFGPVLFQNVTHGQEHLSSARIDPQLRLEHPHAYRDGPWRLTVIAQGDSNTMDGSVDRWMNGRVDGSVDRATAVGVGVIE